MFFNNFLFLLVVSCLPSVSALAQRDSSSINNKLLSSMFTSFEPPPAFKRPFITIKGNKRYNPLVYVSGSLLYGYQNIVSEQIQATCAYHVSCSENMKNQIKRKGMLCGILSGLNQLSNCSGGIKNDYPAYKILPNDKINNEID